MRSFVNLVFVSLLLFLSFPSLAQKPNRVVDSLQTLIGKATEDTTRINYMNEIGYEYVTEDSANSYKFSSQALQLSEKISYPKGRMNAHNVLGLLYYYSGQYDEALKHYKITCDLARQLGDKARLAASLTNTGLVYDDKADYNMALRYYLESLSLLEGNTKEIKWQKAGTLNNTALIYQTQGKYDEALKFHEQSLTLKKEVGNKKGIGSSLHNIGLVYKLKKEYDKSLDYYFQALAVRKENNDNNGTALTLNNIGSVYEVLGKFDLAAKYIEQAMEIRKTMKDKYGLAITLISMGSNYSERKQIDKGVEYYNQALTIGKEIGSKEIIMRSYEGLAFVNSKAKKYEKAYEYAALLMQVKDSIFNLESNQQMNEMQAKYESEKKQKEIELLTKDSEIQSLQLNRNKLWMIVLVAAVLLVLLLAILLFNRYKIKQRANDLLEHQNLEITQQKKEITDSINYAKRIQESILPPDEHWKKLLPQSFIFYRPKDIVSGDFYWIEQKNEVICFAAVDCTGHGVPGALMSVVGFNLLTQAVNEMGLTRPSDILKHLDAGVTKTLRQSEAGKGVKDGMDLALCSLDLKTGELQYAGAFNPLYYISGGILQEIKADKFPIGINLDGKVDEYKNHVVQLKKGDSVYLFSDGYADQFGGPNGKKFKYRNLKELFVSVCNEPVEKQKAIIQKTFDDWKGSLEQIDDIIVIGVKI